MNQSQMFDRLDRWLVDEGRRPLSFLGSAWMSTRERFAFTRQDARLGPGRPQWWTVYRRLAMRRAETLENHRRLNKMTDPFWIGNELMGIGSSGAMPFSHACESLLLASCPAGYAPKAGMPTVEEILTDWALWFDVEYCPETSESGEREMRASALARETLATMEAGALRESSKTIPIKSSPKRL